MSQLVGLVSVSHNKGVQVAAAAHFELDVILSLQDLDVCKEDGEIK